MMSSFREVCVIAAAADLDIWSLLDNQALTAEEMARQMQADLRASSILLDAVTSLGFLVKDQGRYHIPEALRPLLRADAPQTVLPMLLHVSCLIRGWSQLASTVRSGEPAPYIPSIRGPEADRATFVAAMHAVFAPIADGLVAGLKPLSFHHLLDVGGASGTWTLAFLRIVPEAKATIFDLRDAIVQTRERIDRTPFARRIALVGGDFYADELPSGADFAWVSNIIHQHSQQHNRDLFAKVCRALEPGGRIAINDAVMQPDRTQPREGALFAVNMLVETDTGGTFTFDEISADLQSAGFADPQWVLPNEKFQSVVMATKPR